MINLHQRAREYAKGQLDKRHEAKERGEQVGGILSLLSRAFFHGWVNGKRELIAELKDQGIELPGHVRGEDKRPLGDSDEM